VQDLYGLYVLRLIPHWRSDGTLSTRSFQEAYAIARLGLGKRLGLPPGDVPDFAGFRKWYEWRQKIPFELREVRDEMTQPVTNGTLFSQQIAAVTDLVRSQHILRVTEEMLNRYGHVLLVFNASQYLVQEPALETMLGTPGRISDQP